MNKNLEYFPPNVKSDTVYKSGRQRHIVCKLDKDSNNDDDQDDDDTCDDYDSEDDDSTDDDGEDDDDLDNCTLTHRTYKKRGTGFDMIYEECSDSEADARSFKCRHNQLGTW